MQVPQPGWPTDPAHGPARLRSVACGTARGPWRDGRAGRCALALRRAVRPAAAQHSFLKENTTKAQDPPGRGEDRVRIADLADALRYLRSEAAVLGLGKVCLHLDAALRALSQDS